MKAFIISTTSTLSNHDGTLELNLYKLVAEEGWENGVVMGLPNISITSLRDSQFYKELRSIADAESLDLTVIFPNLEDRWELGWDDGNQIFVWIYTSEHLKLCHNNLALFCQMVVQSAIDS